LKGNYRWFKRKSQLLNGDGGHGATPMA
jgi:hypothetical protein